MHETRLDTGVCLKSNSTLFYFNIHINGKRGHSSQQDVFGMQEIIPAMHHYGSKTSSMKKCVFMLGFNLSSHISHQI